MKTFREFLNEASGKYELTDETTRVGGKTLYRIKALKSFGKVKAGDLGGFIQSEKNLSQDGNAWVGDNAKVFDKAQVYDNAEVYGNAQVYDEAWVYGRGQVYGNAKVYDNAKVYGKAQVYGDKHVHEYEGVSK